MDLLAIAKNAADRVEAASVANKVPVAVCVIDVHGNVVLQHRMNGAPVFSIELSERKAYTSALVGMRTADMLLWCSQRSRSIHSVWSLRGDFVRWVAEFRSPEKVR